MIDFEGEFGLRVLQRLQHEAIVWLTTVSADGTPQPNPVWFYWDGENCLIYSKPDAAKLRHIAHNPKVALSFEGATEKGGEVIVLTGDALVTPHAPHPSEGYIRKYQATVEEFGYTWNQLHAEYSVAIQVKPTKYRGF
jgi:PPOX class probable F420-dependent enzyme